MTIITKIDPGMAAALEKAKRAEIKMRKRWSPVAPPAHIDTKVKMLRNGKPKLVRLAVATARRVWPTRRFTNCRAYSRPGDA